MSSLLLAGALSGCHADGPDLAEVRGVVRLDGAPLASALITFNPNGYGTYSSDFTTAAGEYRLRYSRRRFGAMIGQHTITISTAPPGMGGVERVPPRYNGRSELIRDVTAGNHVIDFDLESGGFPAKK